MRIHVRTVLNVTGIVMMVIGVAMLPSFLVSLYCDEPRVWHSFIFAMLTCIVPGAFCFVLTTGEHESLKLRDGFLLVSLCWIVASVVGALPFLTTGVLTNPFDAFFESVSGFSTTGASVISDVESLPKGILFWRSFTHWIGGVGILVFAIALMPSLGISGQNVMSTDTPGLSLGKISPKLSDSMRTLYITYLLFTVVETILLKVGGMSLFDALIHTFGTVGTGGFSSYNEGFAHFDSPFIHIVVIVFMFLCGINFNLYYLSIRRGIFNLFRDIEFRFYALTILVVSVTIALALLVSGGFNHFTSAILDSVFQTVSIMTTTGYTTADYIKWPIVCQMLLLCLMFIGGCSSSTSGGVKSIRILVIIKYIHFGIRTRLHPNSIEPIRINGKSIPAETVSGVTYHIYLYIAIMFIGTFILSFENINMETCFSSVITCLGNIGPAFGDIGTIHTFVSYSSLSKLVLSAAMLAGRLELYTLFILFTPRFWNADH
ncbi:MAG: TrkH family potassium uptake protein [Eubacterium sp.]|nr:TrkH family potassium uptake protein [Candidatus Colimonas fimequi]